MTKKILIITGDPNSINSEIIFKSWKKLSLSIKKKIIFISNLKLLQKQFKKLGYKINIEQSKDINTIKKNNNLRVINIKLNFKNPFKVIQNQASNYVRDSLNLAHSLALNKKNIKGIINCPIDKKLLKKEKIGVTEYLAKKCKLKNKEVMIIRNEKLAVCPITTHIDIKQISKRIKSKMIIEKVMIINKWFKKKLNRNPKISILGLNPHNAEYRKNSEENKIILPAISYLKKNKVKVSGPHASDTIFMNDFKNYDVIVGMYHDQVLSPFKTLFKFDAINLTLGLKYLRVSPDHGVAIELIGKKVANETSLLKCINFIDKYK